MNEDHGKRFADKTARSARREGQRSGRGVSSSAAEGIRDFNCESAWGPDADRHAKVLIIIRLEGSSFGAWL